MKTSKSLHKKAPLRLSKARRSRLVGIAASQVKTSAQAQIKEQVKAQAQAQTKSQAQSHPTSKPTKPTSHTLSRFPQKTTQYLKTLFASLLVLGTAELVHADSTPSTSSSSAAQVANQASQTVKSVTKSASQAVDQAKSTLKNASEQASQAAQSAAKQVNQAVDQTKQALDQGKQQVDQTLDAGKQAADAPNTSQPAKDASSASQASGANGSSTSAADSTSNSASNSASASASTSTSQKTSAKSASRHNKSKSKTSTTPKEKPTTTTVLNRPPVPYTDPLFEKLKFVLKEYNNSLPIPPISQNIPIKDFAGLNAFQLSYAKPINYKLYAKSIAKPPSLFDKLLSYYNSWFSAQLVYTSVQNAQLPPLQFNNTQKPINKIQPGYAKTLDPSIIPPNGVFEVKIPKSKDKDGKPSKEIKLTIKVQGLGDKASIKKYSDNIYMKASVNVANALKTILPINADTTLRTQFNIRQLTTKALQAFGFYGANIEVTKVNDEVIAVKVKPGKPVKINGKSSIIIRGQGTGFTNYQDLEKLFPPVGEVLNTDKYEKAKSYISNTALDNGFFDGGFLQNALYVNVPESYAYWKLDYYTGTRFQISDVEIQGSQINNGLIKNAVTTDPGQYYSHDKVSESLGYLRASKWFDAVAADPIVDHHNKTVKLIYKVIPAKANSLDLSFGYDSFEGLRSKFQYNRHYINSYGGSLSVNSYLSRVKQSFVTNYKHPYYYDPTFKTFNLGVNFVRELQPALNTYTRSFVSYINYTRVPANNWQLSASLFARKDLWTYNFKKFNTNLIYLDVNFARTSLTTDIALNFKTSFLTERFIPKSVKFNSMSLKFGHIFKITDSDDISLNFKLAKIWTNNFYNIPPSLRLYSGGPSSIRGYSFNSISSYDNINGIGGLATNDVQLAYLHEIIPNLKGVVFVDGGQSSEKIRWNNLSYGAGIGVRYYLPVGYASFDIAYPIVKKFKWSNISIYLSIATQI